MVRLKPTLAQRGQEVCDLGTICFGTFQIGKSRFSGGDRLSGRGSATRTLARPQARRPCELRLQLIKGPKSLRPEFQGRSYMQSVKCCHCDTGCLLLGQLDAAFKRHFRHARLNPKASLAIVFKGGVNRLRLGI